MAAPKVSVSYMKPAITIEPCNPAILKFPMDRRAKDPANNCVGWQPEPGIENFDNFFGFKLKAGKKGGVYKALKLFPKDPRDLPIDFD